MKPYVHFFISGLFICVLYSCDHKPTTEEIQAQEQRRQDSLTKAAEEERMRIVYEKHLEDSMREVQAMKQAVKDSMQMKLIELKGELEAMETRMNDAKQFQFMRTADEKQQQIRIMKENVEIIKINIQNTESRLQNL